MEQRRDISRVESGILPFDPIVVVRDVMKRWLVILLAAVTVAAGSYLLEVITYEPIFRCDTTIAVSEWDDLSEAYKSLSVNGANAQSFADLLNSTVLQKVMLEAAGKSYLECTISAAVIPETNLVTVAVTASDSRTALLVLHTILEHQEILTQQIMGKICLEMLEEPRMPADPLNPSDAVQQMLRMGILAALTAAFFLGWQSFFRDGVRSGQEGRRKLKGTYLGEIPHERKGKCILNSDPHTSAAYDESIRKLSRRIERAMGKGKVLMVTSVLKREGTSTVACNLALAMARSRPRVLLVNCNTDGEWLSDSIPVVPHEKADTGDAVFRYQNTDLHLLVPKKNQPKQMAGAMAWAREHYDMVVLDVPPMSVAAQAEGMTDYADAGLLVIRQNGATASAVNAAVAALRGGKMEFVGCVLNDVYASVWSTGQGFRGSGKRGG